jgi:hypothetical protein
METLDILLRSSLALAITAVYSILGKGPKEVFWHHTQLYFLEIIPDILKYRVSVIASHFHLLIRSCSFSRTLLTRRGLCWDITIPQLHPCGSFSLDSAALPALFSDACVFYNRRNASYPLSLS